MYILNDIDNCEKDDGTCVSTIFYVYDCKNDGCKTCSNDNTCYECLDGYNKTLNSLNQVICVPYPCEDDNCELCNEEKKCIKCLSSEQNITAEGKCLSSSDGGQMVVPFMLMFMMFLIVF